MPVDLWGRGGRVYCLMDTEFQFYKMKKIMEIDCSGGSKQYEYI